MNIFEPAFFFEIVIFLVTLLVEPFFLVKSFENRETLLNLKSIFLVIFKI
jgi:hypothetical protein